jgi:hypothetical protein
MLLLNILLVLALSLPDRRPSRGMATVRAFPQSMLGMASQRANVSGSLTATRTARSSPRRRRQAAANRRGVAAQVTLSEVHAKPAAPVCGQSTARRVATDLEYHSADR